TQDPGGSDLLRRNTERRVRIRSALTIFQAGPFAEGLGLAVDCGGGLVGRQDFRQTSTSRQGVDSEHRKHSFVESVSTSLPGKFPAKRQQKSQQTLMGAGF
ncbi:hypothetical protein PP718_09565, partial [Ralstonia solanacearum]|nr:hypothetical protein [Ralstonia solanacearum]MDC6240920.1 hypothetical protein [Ralstonia solanacearum]